MLFSTPGYRPTSTQTGERLRSARHEIKRLDVYVHSNDQSLNLNTPESYELTVAAPHSTIEVRAKIYQMPARPQNVHCAMTD